jgi:hypothetical protein
VAFRGRLEYNSGSNPSVIRPRRSSFSNDDRLQPSAKPYGDRIAPLSKRFETLEPFRTTRSRAETLTEHDPAPSHVQMAQQRMQIPTGHSVQARRSPNICTAQIRALAAFLILLASASVVCGAPTPTAPIVPPSRPLFPLISATQPNKTNLVQNIVGGTVSQGKTPWVAFLGWYDKASNVSFGLQGKRNQRSR